MKFFSHHSNRILEQLPSGGSWFPHMVSDESKGGCRSEDLYESTLGLRTSEAGF